MPVHCVGGSALPVLVWHGNVNHLEYLQPPVVYKRGRMTAELKRNMSVICRAGLGVKDLKLGDIAVEFAGVESDKAVIFSYLSCWIWLPEDGFDRLHSQRAFLGLGNAAMES